MASSNDDLQQPLLEQELDETCSVRLLDDPLLQEQPHELERTMADSGLPTEHLPPQFVGFVREEQSDRTDVDTEVVDSLEYRVILMINQLSCLLAAPIGATETMNHGCSQSNGNPS